MSYEGCPVCNAGFEATTGCCFEADELRAAITRAENDLAEARTVAKELLKIAAGSASSLVVPFFSRFPWLSETD